MNKTYDDNEEEVRNIMRGEGNLEIPEDVIDFCEFARSFMEWGDKLLDIKKEYTLISINQAKILLLDKFFEWYWYLPRSHRIRLNPRRHICIFQVFVPLYQRLKVIELAITPPLVFVPPEPPPMKILPRPNLAGIVLGEDIDDDNS